MALSEPFHLQPVLAELFTARDLLDFSPVSPTTAPLSPTPHASLFSQLVRSPASPSPFEPPPSVSPPLSSNAPTSPVPVEPQVRSVEGYSNNLYVGSTDGQVEWWIYDGSAGTSDNRGWKLQNRIKVSSHSVSRIVLLPKVSKCLVLSAGTLHPLSLPDLDPILSKDFAPIRGVVSVALNDDELDLGSEDNMTDMTVVVLKRKAILLCRIGSGFHTIKDIPLPGATRSHAFFGTYLCLALTREDDTYCVVDLSDASMTEVLPVSQVPPGMTGGYKPNPNVVVIPGENQFLVTSFTGASTMGVFLNNQGDPERGTIEWEAHPLSMAVESGFIIALLRNNTITIHSLENLDRPAQVIPVDPSIEAFGLSYSPYGITIRDVVRDERMTKVPFTLLSGKLESSSPLPSWGIPVAMEEPEDVSLEDDPPSGSGLTPPSSPPTFQKQPIKAPSGSSLLSAQQSSRAPFSSAIAETLLIGRHKIQGLTPTPTIIRLERLCAEHKMDEAADLVDEERRRGRRGAIEGDKNTHNATMRLLHLYLACHMLLDTVFERAGDYFVRGKIDPRLVVRLFTKLRGKVIGSADEIDITEGIRPVLADMSSIDDIITDFINRHATNHTQSEKDELHSALYDSAKNMLTEFLSKTRTARKAKGNADTKIDVVIDTTLAKLLADADLTDELMTMLAAPNSVALSELEPFLANKSVLLTVMRRQGRTDRVLELLKEMADQPDPLVPDPVGELVTELDKVQVPDQLRSYALWLVKRNFQQGLNILISKGDKINIDDEKLVQELMQVDRDAANQYLEYAVIEKRLQSPDLHEMLLTKLLDGVAEMANDDGVKFLLEELDAEYRHAEPQAYPVFFAEIAPSTPFKTTRLKLMLFLQGSTLYDLDSALERITPIDALLMERAIVLGRQHKDRAALALLVRALPDSVSAQTYCTQGGEILPSKVARMVIRHVPELASWVALTEGRKRRGTVDADTQHKLIRELLGAYMREGGSTARTAELLSAQGVHLDVLEVLDTAPNEWPLEVVTTFYKRSFRRQLHERAKWQILKSMSAGQNLETSERYLDAIGKIPPVVEDPLDSDDEKVLSEKPFVQSPEIDLASKENETVELPVPRRV